jgi:8-oxo-dGTP pyrophosphatase MutT (NUDIX family)
MTQHRIAHQLTQNVKLLQKVALVQSGDVLVGRRAADPVRRPGCWDLPGGNSEWPEEGRVGFGLHREDLVREILEETGVKVLSESIQHENMNFFETFFDAGKQVFSIIAGWRIELPEEFDRSGITLSSEHTESAWVSQDRLEMFDFGGEKGAFVKEIVSAALKNRS